jgi:hypothetical protein
VAFLQGNGHAAKLWTWYEFRYADQTHTGRLPAESSKQFRFKQHEGWEHFPALVLFEADFGQRVRPWVIRIRSWRSKRLSLHQSPPSELNDRESNRRELND